jgi:hypothetical protein
VFGRSRVARDEEIGLREEAAGRLVRVASGSEEKQREQEDGCGESWLRTSRQGERNIIRPTNKQLMYNLLLQLFLFIATEIPKMEGKHEDHGVK